MPTDLISLANPDIFRDPSEIYSKMRATSPIYHDPVLGLYVVTHDETLRKILDDHETFSSVPTEGTMAIYALDDEIEALYAAAGAHLPLNTLVTTDPPAHARYRSAVQKAVNATSAKRLSESIQTIVDDLIDDFEDAGKTDFVASYALKLPVFVICDLLGVSRANANILQNMAEATTRMADASSVSRPDLLACHAVQIEGQKFFDAHIAHVLESGAENLTKHLLETTADDGTRLTRREVHSIIQALLVGGNDTTPAALSAVMTWLIRRPEDQELLAQQPSLISAFTEEAMRRESPVQGLYRIATRDVEIGGVTIPKGAPLAARYGAANLDPARYPNPLDFDMHRPGIKNHLAFAAGIHFCVGNMLARTEIRISFETILRRLRNIGFADPSEEIIYIDKLAVRNPIALNIVFERR